MYNGKKIVVVTPAGRKRYLEILFRYLLREKHIIDEYRIWVNTKNSEDLKFLNNLALQYPEFVTLDERWKNNPDCGSSKNIGIFFDNCIDPNTIYVRLDDDVVWLSEDFIAKIVQYRINNPDPFLVYPTIINNAICDHILQKDGYYKNLPYFSYDCLDVNAWKNGEVCEKKHKQMLEFIVNKKQIAQQKEWVLKQYERVSINCISWMGETFSKFHGKVNVSEETYLSCDKPKELKKPNVIIGDCECSHFAFFTQRPHMDKTDVLSIYNNLSKTI